MAIYPFKKYRCCITYKNNIGSLLDSLKRFLHKLYGVTFGYTLKFSLKPKICERGWRNLRKSHHTAGLTAGILNKLVFAL